jgi:hypothetical protein
VAATDFLRLPGGVQIVVAVMVWPAIWAAALMTIALAGDLIRPEMVRESAPRRRPRLGHREEMK